MINKTYKDYLHLVQQDLKDKYPSLTFKIKTIDKVILFCLKNINLSLYKHRNKYIIIKGALSLHPAKQYLFKKNNTYNHNKKTSIE